MDGRGRVWERGGGWVGCLRGMCVWGEEGAGGEREGHGGERGQAARGGWRGAVRKRGSGVREGGSWATDEQKRTQRGGDSGRSGAGQPAQRAAQPAQQSGTAGTAGGTAGTAGGTAGTAGRHSRHSRAAQPAQRGGQSGRVIN